MQFDLPITSLTDLLAYWPQAISAVIIIAAASVLSRLIRRAVRKPAGGLRSDFQATTNLLGPVAVWVVALLSILFMFGVNWTTIGLAATGFTFGLSLALGDVLKNAAAAIINVSDHAYKVGHLIEANGGTVGNVDDIGWFSTDIRTPSKVIQIPNDLLKSNKITNFSLEPGYRHEVTVAIDDGRWGSDEVNIGRVATIFDELLESRTWHLEYDRFGNKLDEPKVPDWQPSQIHGDAFEFVFRLWCTDPTAEFASRGEFLRRFFETMDGEDISYGYTANLASPQGFELRGGIA